MKCPFIPCFLAALLTGTAVLAAESKPALKIGNDLPGSFHPFNVANGKYEGKFHCLVCEHGLKPGVLIFIQNADLSNPEWKPVLDLLKELDKYVEVAFPKAQLRAFAVFLFEKVEDVVTSDDERDARAADLRKLQSGGLKEVVLALDSAAGLKKRGYEIDGSNGVVVVFYDHLRIKNIHQFAPGKLTDANVKALMDEIKDKLAPLRKPIRSPTGRALGQSSHHPTG